MYLGFISYPTDEIYQWISKDWEEMIEYCKTQLQITIPEIEQEVFVLEVECLDFIDRLTYTTLTITKASDYSIEQAKEYEFTK